MAEENKPVEAAGVETPKAAVNADAEKDVQSVLAELKGGDAEKPAESAEKQDTEAEKKDTEPAEKETSGANGSGADAAKDEAAEEAKIVAAAAKLGEESEKKEEASKDSARRQTQARGPRGRGGKMVNYRDNIKSDLTAGEQTSDPNAIRKQVEFYFSDSNLPMDKFLLSKVGGSENRPVELSILHSFKRMRRFQPFSAIVEALKNSDKVELTDDNTCVRRKVPLPESVNTSDPNAVKVFEDKALHKSIYAKGFGKEEPSTQFDIEAFFAQFGPTSAIRLRRADDKTFKGSVFVEFDTEDTQKAFLALDPKPKWKGDTELLIKSKKEYCDEKIKEIEAGRLKPSNRFNNRGRGRGRGRGDGNNQNDRDWRERRSEDQKKGYKSQRGNGRGGAQGGRRDVPRNDRGVPIVQATTEDPKDPRESRARASKSNSNSPKGAKKSSISPQPAKTTTATTPPSESTAGQKRAREEETTSASAENGEHPAKKVDVKDG